MAGYKVFVRVEYPHPEGVFSARAMTRARKASFQAMAEKWLAEMLPRHFEPGNTSRYKIARRSEKYLQRKRQLAGGQGEDGIHLTKRNRRAVLFGGQVPLVFHGDLAADVQKHHQIKAFPTRATILLGSGRLKYLVMRPRKKRNVNMAAEITQVTADEARELIAVQAKAFFEALQGSEGKYIYEARS